ncbi:MAG: hypothetical protein JWM42_509, partial [Burkholderia sp.]|nr:hypothetical protein [Burkholderia sp.]
MLGLHPNLLLLQTVSVKKTEAPASVST